MTYQITDRPTAEEADAELVAERLVSGECSVCGETEMLDPWCDDRCGECQMEFMDKMDYELSHMGWI